MNGHTLRTSSLTRFTVAEVLATVCVRVLCLLPPGVTNAADADVSSASPPSSTSPVSAFTANPSETRLLSFF